MSPRIAVASTAAIIAFAITQTALACGGMFCSTTPPDVTPIPPQPVDQTAERIVFEVGETTVTTHVSIQYLGDPEAFAWVIPVPDTPVVAESSLTLFDALDRATNIQLIFPTAEPCQVALATGDSSSGSSGCGCGSFDEATGTLGTDFSENRGGDIQSPGSTVVVYDQGFTDNYEFTTVGAENIEDLVTWLQDNGYNVSDNMVPVMEIYNGPGAQFLAVKLLADNENSSVVPLSFTYPGDTPSIPLRMTAVAAQPLMGIQVFIVANTSYSPSNFASITPEPDLMAFNENSEINYYDWVAAQADQDEMPLFVSEYIGANNSGIFPQYTTISRYYTRLSPHRMTLDPVFSSNPTAPRQESRLLSFVNRPSLFVCGALQPDRVPSLCAFNYCGEGAECAVVDGQVACLCAAGEVAAGIVGPDGAAGVTCVPADSEFGVTAAAGGAGTPLDPCLSTECGAGVCILRGGFPTCLCQDDAAACLEPDGSVLCVATDGDLRTFGAGAGPEAMPQIVSTRRMIRRFSYANALLPILLAAGVLVGIRRRRNGWQ